MSETSRDEVLSRRLENEGPAAPPMANGELVFDEPWQGRVFGMAHTLCDGGLFTWDEFRDALIDEIKAWECSNVPGTEYRYYERFLAAFEAILSEKGICDSPLLEDRFDEFQARPAGHDHRH